MNYSRSGAWKKRLYSEKYKAVQHGFIGLDLYAYWYVPYTNSVEDVIATQRANDFFIGWFLNPLVVRAKKKDTGIVYALKIMDKKFITKENKTAYVKLERIVLDQLDHPGIIRLYFTFQDTFSLYMALESCEGGELFDQITRKGRLSKDEARFYAAEVVEALEYIHKLGLLHRDVKPENLLLTSDGHIKIADFGSVKPMQDSLTTVLPNAASDDKACTFVGTAAYVPPEVLNSSPATVGNDLWALGCTLYQMLSGTSPFKDASEWLIFQRIIARDVKFPDYFSDESRDLIDQLLRVRDVRSVILDVLLRIWTSSDQSPSRKFNLDYVMCLHVVSALYCSMGQYKDAIPLLERSIEIPDMDEGQKHALAKFTRCMQLGDTYALLGLIENSILCYTAGLEIQEQVLGEKDLRLGETCRYVAEAHVQMLQFAEAEEQFL
ncbi:hypothetical protein POM88_021339 [Heracleum sosnowskyi]|uniref:non-specific serine/threonine protein kinase n=1 Tax=Heracleum sosnowskyi TaxID=360622 RepID=A0AAD8ID64_9APIA|nr:hypothetical protein POM88_021339 [Heracleum sosnowskyi]